MSHYRRLTKLFAIGSVAAFSLVTTAHLAGLRFNTTKSIPIGFYWTTDEPAKVGSYVMFCPPTREPFITAKNRGYLSAGFCPGDFGYMMKKILAAKNDEVAVTSAGVYVNSQLLPLSAPRPTDKAGNPMPRDSRGEYTLKQDELLLMSDVSSTSFDARYFGPVSDSQIKTVITPVYTW